MQLRPTNADGAAGTDAAVEGDVTPTAGQNYWSPEQPSLPLSAAATADPVSFHPDASPPSSPMAPTQLLLRPASPAASATQPLSPPVSATVGGNDLDIEMRHDRQTPSLTDETQLLLHPASPSASATQPLSPPVSATVGGATVGGTSGSAPAMSVSDAGDEAGRGGGCTQPLPTNAEGAAGQPQVIAAPHGARACYLCVIYASRAIALHVPTDASAYHARAMRVRMCLRACVGVCVCKYGYVYLYYIYIYLI